MYYISHRGNLKGPSKNENSPKHIENALKNGFIVEIDLRRYRGKLYLGHDYPQYPIKKEFLIKNSNSLIIHAKDSSSLTFLVDTDFHYFVHDRDYYTITSKNYLWSNISSLDQCFVKQCIINQPEINLLKNKNYDKASIANGIVTCYNSKIRRCKGICSDYIYDIYKLTKVS